MTLYARAMARLRRDGWFLLRRGGSPCQAPRGGRPLSPRGGAIPAPAGSPPSLCPKPCRGRHSEKADFCPTPEHVDGCPKGDRLRQPRHEGRVASRVRNPGGIRRLQHFDRDGDPAGRVGCAPRSSGWWPSGEV